MKKWKVKYLLEIAITDILQVFRDIEARVLSMHTNDNESMVFNCEM